MFDVIDIKDKIPPEFVDEYEQLYKAFLNAAILTKQLEQNVKYAEKFIQYSLEGKPQMETELTYKICYFLSFYYYGNGEISKTLQFSKDCLKIFEKGEMYEELYLKLLSQAISIRMNSQIREDLEALLNKYIPLVSD